MVDEPTRRFLTVEQVAEELNVGVPMIRALLKNGELRGLQIGGRGVWRVGAHDLETYITSAYQSTADRIASGVYQGDDAELDTVADE